MARMFVNISPSNYDVAVTNRSMKFALKTGKIKTKSVGLKMQRNMNIKTIERDQLFETNSLKLLKSSPLNEDVNYQWVYPATQKDIDELLIMKGRDEIVITQFYDLVKTKLGLKFKYANGEKELIGTVFKEKESRYSS